MTSCPVAEYYLEVRAGRITQQQLRMQPLELEHLNSYPTSYNRQICDHGRSTEPH